MERSEKAKQFLASLDQEDLKVGDGSDGLPVWIGIDAEAQKVYKVYASGLAQGFGDGRMVIINGLQSAFWRVGRGEQSTHGMHTMLSGENASVIYEALQEAQIEPIQRRGIDVTIENDRIGDDCLKDVVASALESYALAIREGRAGDVAEETMALPGGTVLRVKAHA